MRVLLRENLLAQFSLVAIAMMIALGVVVSGTSGVILNTMMADDVTMMSSPSDQASITEDINTLRWFNLWILAASYTALYGGLVLIVWRGSSTFTKERSRMGDSNRELERQVEEQNVEVVTVAEIAQIVTSTLNINDVYQRFALEVKKLVDFDMAVIDTINHDDDTFTIRYHYGPLNHPVPLGVPIPLEGTKVQQVAKSGDTIRRTIGDGKPKFINDAGWEATGLKSDIMVPLVSKGRVIGIFGLRSGQSHAYGQHEQDILERLAKQIAPAVESSELYERLKEQTEAMAVVDEVARIITSTLDIEVVYEQFALEMKKLVDFDRTSINTVNRSNGTFTARYIFGPINSARPLGVPVPLANTHVEEVVISGKPLRHAILADKPEYSTDAEWTALGIKSAILIPLISKGEVIGTFSLRSRHSDAYGPHDQNILERLAKQIAPAIENARLYQRLQVTSQEVALVDEVARIMTSTLDIEEVYEQFALEMKKLVDFDRAAINTINQNDGTFTLRYINGPVNSAHPLGIPIPLSNTPVEEVVKTGKPFRRASLADEPKFSTDSEWAALGLKSAILIPLISKGEVIGVLGLRSCQSDAYGPHDQNILERLSKQISPAIENARLFEQTKSAEAQLSKLSCAVEQSPCGVLITDTNGEVQYINPKFTAITGYTPEEIIGGNPRILNSGQTPPEYYRQMWETISSGQEWHGEFLNRKKNGEQYWSTESISSIRSPEGKITHYVAVEEDVTERKRLEEQFLQSQKMESVGRLAGGVAHDFNNLLTIILGYSQMAKVKALAGEDISNDLAETIHAAERAAKLTSQLLAFSRKQHVEPRVANLNDIVINLDQMLRRLISEDIELVVIPGIELASIKVDPSQMEQVLMNLAVNARDAMPGGGKIVIETANHLLDEVRTDQLSHPCSAPCVVLTFGDSGIGMSNEVKSRLFEPFFTTKGVGEGTGLGLSTCYGIVEQMGGFIEVESEPDQGTTFKIHIPATIEESAAAPGLNRDNANVPRGTETILIVEDEPALRAMVMQTLQARGYEVLEACNGDEALRLTCAATQTIHALVTDVIMPGIGGSELAEQICAARPDIKVL